MAQLLLWKSHPLQMDCLTEGPHQSKTPGKTRLHLISGLLVPLQLMETKDITLQPLPHAELLC